MAQRTVTRGQVVPIVVRGVQLSRIGFGCGANAELMVTRDRERQLATVGAAIDLGINWFDTAPAYGQGASEENLSAAVDELGTSPHVFTKVALGPHDLRDPRSAVMRSVSDSLERLGYDEFMGLTLHNRVTTRTAPENQTSVGPLLPVGVVLGPGGVLDALHELRSAGKVRLLGFTTLGGQRQGVEALIESGAFDFCNAAYSVLGGDDGMPPIMGAGPGYDVAALAAEQGLTVVGLRIFGGGALYSPRTVAHRRLVRRLRDWGAARGIEPSVVAIRYVLSTPGPGLAVVGFSTPRHVSDARVAMDQGGFSAGELDELEALRRGGHLPVSKRG